MAHLLHDLITNAAWKHPQHGALRWDHGAHDYAHLAQGVDAAAQALLALGIRRGERVALLLDKRPEALTAMFGALAAGATCVPVDPMLKAEQVALILRDSGARMLVTSPGVRSALQSQLARCPDLRCVLQTGADGAAVQGLAVFGWDACLHGGAGLPLVRSGEDHTAALVYKRGASGKPRAHVLSHRVLLACAQRLGARLGQRARCLDLLAFSDAAGLSLLASAFACGGEALLVNNVPARDLAHLSTCAQITALAAPPWLWMGMAASNWGGARGLRCLTSVGGTLPRPTLDALRRRLPLARVYLLHERLAGGGESRWPQLVDHPDGALARSLPAI